MSFQWQTPPDEAFGDLTEAYVAAIHQAIFTLAQRYAPEIEAWMKANAPWTDRTGNARQTLWSDVFDLTNSAVVIVMSHGVDYDMFLELAHGGRYAILGPALDHFIPRIWRDVRRLVSVR